MKDVPSSPLERRALRVLTDGCRYSTRGIPTCGVLLGAAHGGNTDPTALEEEMGHPLGVHRTYYHADGVDKAVATAQQDLEHLRVPWISFKPP